MALPLVSLFLMREVSLDSLNRQRTLAFGLLVPRRDPILLCQVTAAFVDAAHGADESGQFTVAGYAGLAFLSYLGCNPPGTFNLKGRKERTE